MTPEEVGRFVRIGIWETQCSRKLQQDFSHVTPERVADYLFHRMPREVLDLILFHEGLYVEFCSSSCPQRADFRKQVKVYLEESFDGFVEVPSVMFQVTCYYAVGEVLRYLTDFVPRFRRR